MTPEAAALQPLIQKFRSFAPVSPEAEEAISSLRHFVVDVEEGEPITREGDKPETIAVMLSGVAFRHKETIQGRRQITSFHVAGDMVDLQSKHLPVMDHGIMPAIPSRIARISHDTLADLFAGSPEISNLFYQDAFIDSAIFREWVVNVGARDALTRTAHLLCEIVSKMQAVHLCDELAIDLPLTQQVLADAAGMSLVHMNRSLQFLRKMNLVRLKAGVLDIRDWDGLKVAGDFDPSYWPVPGFVDTHLS